MTLCLSMSTGIPSHCLRSTTLTTQNTVPEGQGRVAAALTTNCDAVEESIAIKIFMSTSNLLVQSKPRITLYPQLRLLLIRILTKSGVQPPLLSGHFASRTKQAALRMN